LSYFDTPQLHMPGNGQHRPLTAMIGEPSVAQALDELPDGETGATFSLHVREAPPVQRRLRNVAAILRGSDVFLRDTFVLLTAHYDGTGPTASGSQDRIWNAANDNASGVAALLDVALALGTLKEKPRRSLVFLTFFGEEDGMLGSRYYAKHPLVPIRNTIAAINLEQLGRTDAAEGDQAGKASITGYDYSEIGEVFKSAGERSGIAISGNGLNSDKYFMASDNIVFAELGVPAHTLCVSYMYPDYHGARDHWDKIDFDNMAGVTRMAARALLLLALSDRDPLWNTSNPRAARFSEARGRRSESR
jgi:Zn-dependent M28 family amino/carboxypeptidase